MTSGTKTTDFTSLAKTVDISYPTESESNVSYQPVGFKWTKTWSGGDYPPTEASTIFGWYWRQIEREFVGFDGKPVKKMTYVQRWEARKSRPRRTYQVEHPYSCTIEFWSDALYQYRWMSFYPPYAIDARGVKTFKLSFSSIGPQGSSLWNANDTIALRGKLRQQIVGSDFDMGVFLGEGREALKLITDTAVRIRKGLQAARRGNLVGAAEALGVKAKSFKAVPRQMSQRWLELQYGWLPLLSDAQGGAQALAQQLNNPAVQTYRARMKKDHPAASPTTIIRDGNGWFFHGETRAQLIAKVKEVDVPALNGLTDPSGVLWELLPWSFVADWFIPIGNYLEARGLARAVTGTFVETITTREFATCNALYNKSRHPVTGNLVQIFELQPQFRSGKIVVSRTVSTTLSTPRPQFKPLSEVLSWKRATNAVALLVTGFSGARFR